MNALEGTKQTLKPGLKKQWLNTTKISYNIVSWTYNDKMKQPKLPDKLKQKG